MYIHHHRLAGETAWKFLLPVRPPRTRPIVRMPEIETQTKRGIIFCEFRRVSGYQSAWNSLVVVLKVRVRDLFQGLPEFSSSSAGINSPALK